MWIEKTKNGKYKFCEEYKDLAGNRKRVSITYEKNTASIRKQAVFDLQEKIDKKLETGGKSLKSLVEMFLNEKKKTLKESTHTTYANAFGRMDLSIKDINSYTIMKISEPLCNFDKQILKSFLKWGRNKFLIAEDFSRIIELNKTVKKGKTKFLEKEEIEEMLKMLDGNKSYTGKLTRLLVEFLILTGLRIGEALALEYGDIEGDILHINKRNYFRNIDTPKSASSVRDIAINSRGKQIISEVKFLKRTAGIESDIIFCTVRGRYYSSSNFTYILKPAGIHFHMLRHTHASLLAEQGVPLDAIQRRLGHENDKITKEIYIHITSRQKEKDNDLFKKLDIL